MPHIRPARPADRDALYDICLKTAASGADGTHLYRDPRLIGHIYAAPYLEYQSAFAFVLEDEAGVAGYVLGALDTRAFEQTLEREWWPALRQQYPAKELEGLPATGRTPDQHAIHLIHQPPVAPAALLAQYPSHLHIDLLPRVQGGGYGRRLLHTLFAALREAGSPGVHLGVGGKNTNAQAFYRHIGFQEWRRHADGGATLVWRL